FGFQMETLILKAQQLSFGTCWLGGTFSRTDFANLFNLNLEERLLAITPIGIPAKSGRRLKEKVIRGFIRADSRKRWNQLFFNGIFAHPLNPETISDSLKNLLEGVRLAPSGGNKQPWRILVDPENQDVHFFQITNKSNYASIRKIDMGIAISHFELIRLENEIEGTWNVLQTPPTPSDSLQLRYVISWHAKSNNIF
ncbi:MAG: nitroreductase family protein, partial [Promethearchaeota archaeon]